MKNRRKQREVHSHAAGWSFAIALIALCFVAYGAVQGALGVMNSWLEELPSIEDSDAFNFAEKTRVYANDGTTLLAEFFVENREPVSIDEISPFVLEGTVDTEDVRFYEHNGVDPQGIARALVNNMRGGALEGASTITQQFVRNTLLVDEATDISFERKIREAELATQLEKQYSKDEILLMYLNTINYGDGCYGIEAAAKNYFQKSALDLTLVEAATLVGIPQSPTYLNPKTNPDACLDRRNTVLSRMLAAGGITKDEYDEAIAQELVLDPAPPRATDGIYAYPYFTSYVRQVLLEEYSQAEVFKGGLTVYTTIDPAMQAKAELACENQYARMAEEDEVSLTCIDPNTGYILAMVGGKNYEEEEWNLATQGGRPAGSSFKPFTLTAAIEQGINPSTLIDCTSPYKVGNDTFENYGNINYGIRSIQSATAVSSNTAYIRLSQKVTPDVAVDTAYRLGITTNQDKVMSATLGPGNVNSLEMASAYGTFATGGIKHSPEAITQILDRNGNEIDASNTEGERVISEEVAYAVTKVLKTVFTEGTAAGYAPYSGQPVAGKTGTSSDFKDHWLVGYTPHLSCAIWIGDPDFTQPGNQNLSCNAIWQDFMNMALEGYEYQDFTPAADPVYDNKFNKEQNDKLYKETEAGKKEEAEKKKKEEEEKAKKEKQEADEKKQQEEANKPTEPAAPPNVVGMTLDQAAGALAGFTAEYVEEYHATVPKGVVISQETVGGKVRLHVSLGPAPGG